MSVPLLTCTPANNFAVKRMLSPGLPKIISTKSEVPFLGHPSFTSSHSWLSETVDCNLTWTKTIISWSEPGQGADKVNNQLLHNSET